MKIVSKNRSTIIAVHDGMPLMFSVDALNQTCFVAKTANTPENVGRKVVGRYITKDYEMLDIGWDSKFHKLLKERLEKKRF